MTNLSNINLNLLYALEALLNHEHVTQAAYSIGVSQAAMSASLKQLRAIYNDPLLVRGQHSRMALTPLAQSLKPTVRRAIEQAEAVLFHKQSFEPQSSQRVFHIGMSDYLAFVLLPPLMRYLNQYAPHVSLIQHPINYLDSVDPFETQGLDLVIGDFPYAPQSLMMKPLFTDNAMIVFDKQHPLSKQDTLTLEAIAKYSQVFVSLEERAQKSFIHDYMLKQQLNPAIALFTPHTLIALQALPQTQLVTHTVKRLAKPFLDHLGLTMKPAPYQKTFPPYKARQYWHPKMQTDPGHRWLRQIMGKLVTTPAQ